MERPRQMLDLADDPSQLQKLKTAHGRNTSLLSALEATGQANRIRGWSKCIRGDGTAAMNRKLMLSICREFDLPTLRQHFGRECRNHLESALYTTPGRFFVKQPLAGMVIYKDEHVQIHYMHRPPRQLIAAPEGDTETGITIIGMDSLVLFAQTEHVSHQTFSIECDDAAAPALGPPSSGNSQSGDFVFLEGGRQGMRLLQGDAPTSMIICLAALPRCEATKHFSLRTSQLVGCTAARITDSRLQLIATALAQLGGSGAANSLLDLSHHPTTFVRWNALRALYQVDPKSASTRLSEMREDDPSDEIRSLAARSMEQG